MTVIDFTYKGQHFTLDTGKGQLLGEKGNLMADITGAVAQGLNNGQYGSGYSPIPPTRITDPYHHADQFSLCLLFNLHQFPEELQPFVPAWHEIDRNELDGLSEQEKQDFMTGLERLEMVN